jgi:hypothetical protein
MFYISPLSRAIMYVFLSFFFFSFSFSFSIIHSITGSIFSIYIYYSYYCHLLFSIDSFIIFILFILFTINLPRKITKKSISPTKKKKRNLTKKIYLTSLSPPRTSYQRQKKLPLELIFKFIFFIDVIYTWLLILA